MLAEGEKVEDDWLVLGRVIEPDDRLTVRRVWLRGATTGRLGLILNFAAAGRPLDPLPARPGEYVPGALSFYPGALPMRALLTQTAPRLPAPRPPDSPRARRWRRTSNPSPPTRGTNAGRWSCRTSARRRTARAGRSWTQRRRAGDPAGVDPWKLLAVSAGDPVTVAGEWNRAGFRPMTCWHGDRPVIL